MRVLALLTVLTCLPCGARGPAALDGQTAAVRRSWPRSERRTGLRTIDDYIELLLDGKVAMNPSVQYAYGFIDRVIGGRRFVGHSGGAPGMNGDLAFEPNGGYVVVVLSNLDPPVAGNMSAFILSRLPAISE